jgi:hypothetical protein
LQASPSAAGARQVPSSQRKPCAHVSPSAQASPSCGLSVHSCLRLSQYSASGQASGIAPGSQAAPDSSLSMQFPPSAGAHESPAAQSASSRAQGSPCFRTSTAPRSIHHHRWQAMGSLGLRGGLPTLGGAMAELRVGAAAGTIVAMVIDDAFPSLGGRSECGPRAGSCELGGGALARRRPRAAPDRQVLTPSAEAWGPRLRALFGLARRGGGCGRGAPWV